MAELETTDINEEVVEAPAETPAEPTVPEPPLEEAEPLQEPGVEEAPPAEEPEERPQSRREALRIAKLVEKQVQQRQPQQPQPESGLNYRDVIEGPDELYGQLEGDRKAAGQAGYTEGVKQAESLQFHTRLEIDAPRVEGKYPQLNPSDKENFDPRIADALNTHYLNLVGYDPQARTVQNPNLRYADFVEAQYELADALANDKVSKTSKNIARQAATTGLRPDGSSAKRLDLTKPPGQMTDEELAAVIGQAIPKK